MNKVKMFESEDIEEIENDVNEFIKDKQLIDMKLNTTTEHNISWYTVMVLYHEE